MRLAAAAVHVLTATGAIWALLALLAVHAGDYNTMFIWLGVALVVDAVDGPLARWVGVTTALPRYSGTRLDLIVDYLTYVVVPAYALSLAEILPEDFRLAAAMVILLSSLAHVADRESKTEEGFFVGFPAIWNIVCLYLFALGLPPFIALGAIVLFAAATFIPILCVHPFRVLALRPVTVLVTLAWGAAATVAVLQPFPSALWVKVALLGTASYLIAIGLIRALRGRPLDHPPSP